MNTNRIVTLALAGLVTLGTASGMAYAATADQSQDARDTALAAGMKVTLTQAIATAEQHAGGRAIDADVSQDKGATRIDIEVVGSQGVRTVSVDGQTGQVTAMVDRAQDGEAND